MLKLAGAAVVIGLSVGLALADEFSAVITKVDAASITFHKVEKGRKAADASAMPVAENVGIARAEFNREAKQFSAGAVLQGGLKNEIFANIGAKGVGVRIVTDAGNKKVTHILAVGAVKKKKG